MTLNTITRKEAKLLTPYLIYMNFGDVRKDRQFLEQNMMYQNMVDSNQPAKVTRFCHERNGRQYVLAQLSVKKKLLGMSRDIVRQLIADVDLGRKNVNRFYEKAMDKFRQGTTKEICKLNPKLGAMIIKRSMGI